MKIKDFHDNWTKSVVVIDKEKYKIFWIEDSTDGIPELKEETIPESTYLNQVNTPEQEEKKIYKEEGGIVYYKNKSIVARALQKKLEELKEALKKKSASVSKALRKNKKNIGWADAIYAPYIPLTMSSLVSVQPMSAPNGKVFSMNHIPIIAAQSNGKSMFIPTKSRRLISPGISTRVIDTSSISMVYSNNP